MTKRILSIAAAISICFVIAIFAGSGDRETGASGQDVQLAGGATIPEVINYQGVLTDIAGNPINSTVALMLFTIYDAEGKALWMEPHNWVPVANGLFNVLLGIKDDEHNNLRAVLRGSEERWLGIKVDDDAEMTPRQRIASVPYAFRMDEIYVDDVGNVGIGIDPTQDPVEKLEVAGGIAMQNGGCIRIRDSYSPGNNLILRNGFDSYRNNLYLGDYLDFYVPGAGNENEGSKMTIQENGNVSIGTTNPGRHKLYVTSDIGFDPYGGSAVSGATALIENTRTDGIGMIVSVTSSDLPLYVAQHGTGDMFRCDSWIGGWHPVFRVENDGKTTCSVLQITGGSDIAEPFDVAKEEAIEAGMVLTIDLDNPGKLKISQKAYDRCVAGIVSGAAGIQPGMVMGQTGTVADGEFPVALSGRVYCRTDASGGPIRPGDLLTTSDTPGHAMKVTDFERAQGAILGKAMGSLEEGQGLVLVLVTLQ